MVRYRIKNRMLLLSSLILASFIAISIGFAKELAVKTTAENSADASYQIRWLRDEKELAIKLCVPEEFSTRLINHNFNLSKHTRDIKQGDKALVRSGTQIRTRSNGNNCIRYKVNVSFPSRRNPATASTDFLLVSTQSWLWFSPNFKFVEIEVIDGNGKPINAFFPFQRKGKLYKFANTGLEWESRTLLGNVKTYHLSLANTHLEVAIAGKANERYQDWLNWLSTTALAIESVYGTYPIDEAKVLIVPIGKRSGPIPWGEVQRGGFPSVHFFIDETRPVDEFIEDWTGSHELSHLLLPKLSHRDRWMSEGIASYYQNIARARTGLLSESEAWAKLKQGFARGRRDFNDRSLRDANKIMHIYWGGVAYFFLADLRLREKGLSLDWVLKRFNQCCLPGFSLWTAEKLAKRLDDISGSTIFISLLRNEAQQKQFLIQKPFERRSNPLLQKHLKPMLNGSPKTQFEKD